jgi:RNA polymerase sigma factor (sigma-70 family)
VDGAQVTETDNPDLRAGKEDEWLVVRCQLGERQAFDELIARYHEPIWQYVRRVVGDDDAAKEVNQDLWLRVLRGIARLRDGARLRAWLFGIARRALMDRLRERYAKPVEVSMDEVEVPAGSDSNDREDQLHTVERELARLPIIEREILTLFYLKELSLADVAQVLEVPVGTVKSRLFRARQMLRRELILRGEP